MSHALCTFVAPLALARLADAEAAIERLGNPATAQIANALGCLQGDDGTHFASLHAFKSVDGARAYILLEFSADGTEPAALARIVAAMGSDLRKVFLFASDWKDGIKLARYLSAHRVSIGGGWLDNPGVAFVGTPGMSVGRILMEDRVSRAVAALLTDASRGDALACLADVRRRIAADASLAPALQAAPVAPPFTAMPTSTLVYELATSFIYTYFKYLVGAVLLISIAVGIGDAWGRHGFFTTIGEFVAGAVVTLWNAFWITLSGLAVAALLLYLKLRKAEENDFVDEHVAGPSTNTAMFSRENAGAQNHMISITQRKPGWVRWYTIRLIFWIIGALAPRLFKPGYLGSVGTIHFARWVTPPGSRDLIFLSNFGGSWESYLEDFITRAHAGLTGVWSNTMGFPRAANLIQLGATDGDRFKRFARHSMIPTRFWYGAYPHLTTNTIRSNAQIRAGLSGAMTEDEARRWLALFASAARPAAKLVSTDIQSVVFGGFGFMPFSTCLILDLPEGRDARAWLREIGEHLAFNDGRRVGADAVANLALGPRGLQRLGLSADGLNTFPFAFIAGMTTDYRAKILGDVGDNAPEHWRWGREQADAALLLYGRSQAVVDDLEKAMRSIALQRGATVTYARRLKPVTKDKREPFGFIDGTSQPVIRGTYKALRGADPIHIVEAGEFVLGYPDNRGYMPLTPTMPALDDPGNRLPLLERIDERFARTVVEGTRDLGFNGSFLVIRELEQDVSGFRDYCEREAARLRDRLPPPYNASPDFVGAKLIGRWQDGSSMVRHPYESETDSRKKIVEREKVVARSTAIDLMVEHATTLSRPKSNPAGDATPVEAAPPPKIASPKPVSPTGIASATGGTTRDGIAAGSGMNETAPQSYADNDFLFGAEDPEALNCPFGAHIRRANPRDSLDPSSADQIDISNRHRIMRIGRQYAHGEDENPGLFFMCLNGDIERQFEFLQQTWLRSPSFHGLSCEKDPVLGDAEDGNCGFTIASRLGPTRLEPLPRFVTTRGGGYFFLPGKRLLDYLGDLP